MEPLVPNKATRALIEGSAPERESPSPGPSFLSVSLAESSKRTAAPCALPQDAPLEQPRQQAGPCGEEDEVMVVRFEPVENREGVLLVIAHVVSARLSDLLATAEADNRSKARLPPLPEPSCASVQLTVHQSDALQGEASVRVERGALGAMTLQLRLDHGKLELYATVSSERAAQALASDRELLARNLSLQGIELARLDIVVERSGLARKSRPRNGGGDDNRKNPRKEE
jgi:hypothetical protein